MSISKVITEYHSMNDTKKELEKKLKKMKAEIMDYLIVHNNSFKFKNVTAILETQIRTGVDTALVRKNHPEYIRENEIKILKTHVS